MSATHGLALGLEIDGDGAHPAAWRAVDHGPASLLTPQHLAGVGRRHETAGFGFLTLDDATPDDPGPGVAGRFDPVTAASFLSAHTDAVGLVPVVHTAHAEPFHVANRLAGLDHASVGRAGWLLGVEATGARAAAHGERHETDRALLAAEAADVVDAARRLWDSWQDDAIVADEPTGRFLDADRVHHVDFRGRSFSVRGPALVPRSPQGQVPVLAPVGALPAELVDVVTIVAPAVDELLDLAGGAGPRTCAEVEVVLDTDVAAAHRLAALDRWGSWSPGRRLRHVGDVPGLVAVLARLAGAFDAVRLVPAVLDVDGAVLADEVLPALGALVRRPARGRSLRDLFGLRRPASRYAS